MVELLYSSYDANFKASHNYCLFIDSLCLEPLDQEQPGLRFPVVELLSKDWTDPLSAEDRQSAVVQPRFHDGVTEYDEEDIGWTYMPVSEYVDRYDRLGESQGWEDTFVRPLYLDGSEREDQLPGAWRRDGKGIEGAYHKDGNSSTE